MNEKSIQLGGGRKGRFRKYLFGKKRDQKHHVRLQNENLQLMTVVECICADETILPPGFVLEEKQGFCPEWFEDVKYNQNYL